MTEFESTDPPRDISVDTETRDIYTRLTEMDSSPFSGAELNDLFVFAAAFGFNQGLRTELGSTHALANRDALSDKQKWILKAIALKEVENESILNDGRQIYAIAEEYAEGGIRQLENRADKPGDLFKDISNEIIKLNEDI